MQTTNGVAGYVVAPATYHDNERAKATHEPATITFALKRVAAKWPISGWSWNGTVPKSGP